MEIALRKGDAGGSTLNGREWSACLWVGSKFKANVAVGLGKAEGE